MEQSKIWSHFQDPANDGFREAGARYRTLVGLAERHVPRGRALNLGIGGGGVERRFLSHGWSVASLDPDANAVDRLRVEGIDARQGYAQTMPFESSAFDAVVISEVLEHIPDDARPDVISELRRVLRADGVLVGTVPYRENLADQKTVCPACGNTFHRWGHVASFDVAGVRSLLAPHFRVERCAARCFVNWHGPLSIRRILKNAAKSVLGRLGEPIVAPSLLFVARAGLDRP
jgi:SAM-dependent methyltransferase